MKNLFLIILLFLLPSCYSENSENYQNWSLIMTSKVSGEHESDYLIFRADNSNLYVELFIPSRYISEEDDSSDECSFSDEDFPISSNEIFLTRWPCDVIPPTNIHYTFHLENKTSNIIKQKINECFSNSDKLTYRTKLKKLSNNKLRYLAFEVNTGAFYTFLARDSKLNTEIIIYPVYLDEKNDSSLFKLLKALKKLPLEPNSLYFSQILSDFIGCGINATNMSRAKDIRNSRSHDSKTWLPNSVKPTLEDLEAYKIYLEYRNLKQ